MKIGDICRREVYVANPGETLLEAAREMRRRNVGCVVVVEQRGKCLVPVGILTDRDIARALPDHPAALGDLPVARLMTREPFVLPDDESIVDAVARLRDRGVRRAPVVAASGDLVGIVSTDDLLGVIARQLDALAQLAGRQRPHAER